MNDEEMTSLIAIMRARTATRYFHALQIITQESGMDTTYKTNIFSFPKKELRDDFLQYSPLPTNETRQPLTGLDYQEALRRFDTKIRKIAHYDKVTDTLFMMVDDTLTPYATSSNGSIYLMDIRDSLYNVQDNQQFIDRLVYLSKTRKRFFHAVGKYYLGDDEWKEVIYSFLTRQSRDGFVNGARDSAIFIEQRFPINGNSYITTQKINELITDASLKTEEVLIAHYDRETDTLFTLEGRNLVPYKVTIS